MSRITAARRSKSFAPAHFNAFIKKERPSWTAQYALPTQDEEIHSVDDTNKLILTIKLKHHRKMGNRATDLARLRDESTDLQARIERFKVVAHEAAAKAQMINSGALTLRARHAPSISAITRPPPRHRACWPSSVSYRCASSTSAQRSRRQLSPVAAPAPPHPAYLTKTESKHTLSLGDFLATIPGEHRANTLRKRKAAPPASPPARGEEEESVAKEEAEAILSSPVLKRRLQDALLAQIEADRETTSVTISITISSTSAAGETDTSRLEETSIAANNEEGEEKEEEVVVAAVEEVVVLERNTRAFKSADKHVDEGMLKRKDIVVRKKKKEDDLRDEEEEADEDEPKRRGKKRKTASAFLASIINPKKKMKKSKRARKERESVADEAKENEKKVNMAAAAIEQEKHDQRVAYIKRKIEERYGVVRREAKLSGKRVRIQEPNAAAVAVPQPPSSEGKQTGEAREKVVCNETTATTVEGGGRRRRAVTVEEVTSEMASAIAGARQPLIKQRGVILLDKENLGNVAAAGETKKETVVTKNNKTKADTDDTKKRKTKKSTRNISSSSASLTSSSACSSSSGSAILVSSAGGRGVDVPRRPLQPRN